MTYDRDSPARDLVDHFLEDEVCADAMQMGLVYRDGEFYKWKDGCYLETSEIEIKTKFTSWAIKFEGTGFKNTRSASEEALHHIKTRAIIPSSKKRNEFLSFESSDHFVAFKNGIVNISDIVGGREFELIPHTPQFFNLAKIPYDFSYEGACPIWKSILNTILPAKEDRRLLQQWFGYHLTPGLSRAKMMFLEGQGANGKSVVLFVLRLLLGDENVSSIPLSGFDPDKTFKLAVTDGKFANICEEAGQINVRTEEALKQFAAGNAFTVEKKFKQPYHMYPTAKLSIATNDIPQFRDKSDGIWRRMLYIKFGIKISAKDQNRDYLERNFWLNSGELPGILNWALDGARDLEMRNHFISSARKVEELQVLKMNSDLLRSWVVDHFELEIGYQQPTSKILELFNSYCYRGLLPKVSIKELYREIESQFPSATRPPNAVTIEGQKVRVMSGVRLVKAEQVEQEITI